MEYINFDTPVALIGVRVFLFKMNAKIAKLLRKFSKENNVEYKFVKREWKRLDNREMTQKQIIKKVNFWKNKMGLGS